MPPTLSSDDRPEARIARIGVTQLELLPGAVDSNRRRTVEAIEECVAAGAQLVVLPELAASGYRLQTLEAVAEAAEEIPGPSTEAWRAAAGPGCTVVGGICERRGDQFFNSVAVVGAEGVIAIYRKLHLFDEEHLLFSPGDAGLPVFDLPFGRVGVLVCYDLRFPEALRILKLQGADVVAVPTAWSGGFDPTPPADGIIDQVRAAAVQANLNSVFVAASSRIGEDDGVRYLGSSCVVNPYGRFVLDPQPMTREVVEVVEVDLADARRADVRAPRIRPLADRRTDVYGELLGYPAPGAAPRA